MGLLNWILGPREVHIHVHGTVNLKCDNLQLKSEASIESNKPQTVGPGLDNKIAGSELEPDLGHIQLPEVDFGEDVET